MTFWSKNMTTLSIWLPHGLGGGGGGESVRPLKTFESRASHLVVYWHPIALSHSASALQQWLHCSQNTDSKFASTRLISSSCGAMNDHGMFLNPFFFLLCLKHFCHHICTKRQLYNLSITPDSVCFCNVSCLLFLLQLPNVPFSLFLSNRIQKIFYALTFRQCS